MNATRRNDDDNLRHIRADLVKFDSSSSSTCNTSEYCNHCHSHSGNASLTFIVINPSSS